MFYISSLMFNGNFVCALRVFLVGFRQQNPHTTRSPAEWEEKRFTHPAFTSHHGAITHVFEATDIGGGEIVSGPAPPQPDGVFPSSNRG